MYRSFGLTLQVVLSFLQKLKATNNSIAILGYPNDKSTYIAKNIISIDWLIIFSARFRQDLARSTNRVRPITSRCAFRKV